MFGRYTPTRVEGQGVVYFIGRPQTPGRSKGLSSILPEVTRASVLWR